MDWKRIFLSFFIIHEEMRNVFSLQGNRDESMAVDAAKAKNDAQTLYEVFVSFKSSLIG